MGKYTIGETKLIMCPGCSEMVSVPAEYKGNLCPSCEESDPYGTYGYSSEKQTRKSSNPLGDHTLFFRKMILATSSRVKV